MAELLQIKCPFCSALLSVKNQPGIESKRITCPICKHTNPFTFFKTPSNDYNSDHTVYPGMGDNGKINGGQINIDPHNVTPGILIQLSSFSRYQLKHGRNVIGRKADASKADIQIPTGESRKISREHIVIEVKNIPAKGLVHYASLYKERVNKTYVGTEELFFGDTLILKNGDIIKLPEMELRFEIPDDDATTLG